jgi:hypothetical protein
VAYAVENALFQWEEGERRVREDPGLERPVDAVVEELRKRLGSTFSVDELAAFYGEGTDWAHSVAAAQGGGVDAGWAVDAAFNRYAREASNYAGGRPRSRPAAT